MKKFGYTSDNLNMNTGYALAAMQAFLTKNKENTDGLGLFYDCINFLIYGYTSFTELSQIDRKIEQGANLTEQESSLYEIGQNIRSVLSSIDSYQHSIKHFERESRLIKVNTLLNVYSRESLAAYLANLREYLDKAGQDIAFSAGSMYRLITVCYDSANKKWLIFNAGSDDANEYPALNNVEKTIATQICRQASGMSQIMLDNDIEKDRKFILSLDFYCAEKNRAALESIFACINKQFPYTVTSENARYIFRRMSNPQQSYTLLDLAIKLNHPQTIYEYQNLQIKFDTSMYGMTPLQYAAYCNSADVVDALITCGVKPDKTFIFKSQAMSIAAIKGNVDVLHAMDRCKWDVTGRGSFIFFKPEWMAMGSNQPEVADFIESVEKREEFLAHMDKLTTSLSDELKQSAKLIRLEVEAAWQKAYEKKEYSVFKDYLSERKKKLTSDLANPNKVILTKAH